MDNCKNNTTLLTISYTDTHLSSPIHTRIKFGSIHPRHDNFQNMSIANSELAMLIDPEPHIEVRRKNNPSLVWVLVKTFWKIFIMSAFFKLLQDLLLFVSPQILK